MKTRHVITIGILSAIAVALLGIAIALGKVNKPKTLQTNATSEVISYRYDPNIQYFTITGQPQYYSTTGYDSVFETATGTYQVKRAFTNFLEINYRFNYIIAEDGFDGAVYTFTPTKQLNLLITINSSKSISSIQLIQQQVTQAQQEENLDLYNYVFYYGARIYYTDATTTEQFDSFNLNNININDYYWEPINNEYLWENIEIENTLATLKTAYQTGYSTGGQQNEIVPIRNIMLEILTMPFTFINQAFDVTLWEGTAYAVNIGNFIKGIIAILSIIFIIKLFTSGFSVLGNYIPSVSNKKSNKPTIAKKTTENVMKRHDAKVEKNMNDGFRRG